MLTAVFRLLGRGPFPTIRPALLGPVRAGSARSAAGSKTATLWSLIAGKDAAIFSSVRFLSRLMSSGERPRVRSAIAAAREEEFWILDFGFWIAAAFPYCLKSRIQNLKSKIFAPAASLFLFALLVTSSHAAVEI